MSTITTSNNIKKIKEFIYNHEQVLIRRKRFLENNRPIFLDDLVIKNETGLSDIEIHNAIENLRTNNITEFIIFKNPQYQIDPKKNPEYFIRSRMFHTVWCLYKSINILSRPRQEQSDVGDLQYIRYIKRRPKRSNLLVDIFNDVDVKKILNYPSESIILDTIKAIKLDKNLDYEKISNFQLKSTITILKNLATKKQTKGIVIVAGTGSGKSFAYQFPILLWILNKKIKKHEEFLQRKTKKLEVNCSAILIFPRNALAQDQHNNLIEIIRVINEHIDSIKGFGADKKKFLKIKEPMTDFFSKVSQKLDEKYGTDPHEGNPDIIITSPESLTRRLLNPTCHQVYRKGIDLVLFDEVHLWEGLHGAYISSLTARLRNLLEHHKKPPLFVGMSATIEQPDSHCQKLFSLSAGDKPKLISQDENDDTEPYSIEHHLMLKPRSGRSPLGVAINTTSCLIHNRRDGLANCHSEPRMGGQTIDTERKPKSITFIDSLNTTAGFTDKLNDYEFFKFPNHRPGVTPGRKYIYFNRPEQRLRGNNQRPNTTYCNSCIDRTLPMMLSCQSYIDGKCWYSSQDDADFHSTQRYGNWIQLDVGRVEYPTDNIRSERVSSVDRSYNDKYEYFRMHKTVPIYDRQEPPSIYIRSEIDNIVATSAMEVGVDFKNIKEIIQYGDIRSPSSYRQKTGRGAREGNQVDGLFVLSIINNTPLGYSRFKHFSRLVYSSLDPIKLQPTNPFILKSQCFSSIFDFIATCGINIFDIGNMDPKILEKNFAAVQQILSSKELKTYLENFIALYSNFTQNIITETIDNTEEFIKKLSEKYELEVNNKKIEYSLYQWLIKSQKDNEILVAVMNKFGVSDSETKNKAIEDMSEEVEKLKAISKEFFPNDNEIDELLDRLPEVLK